MAKEKAQIEGEEEEVEELEEHNEVDHSGSETVKKEIEAYAKEHPDDDEKEEGGESDGDDLSDEQKAEKEKADKEKAEKDAAGVDDLSDEQKAEKAEKEKADKAAAEKAEREKAEKEEKPPEEITTEAGKKAWYNFRQEQKADRKARETAEARVKELEAEKQVAPVAPTGQAPADAAAAEKAAADASTPAATANVFALRHKAQQVLDGYPQDGIKDEAQAREMLGIADQIIGKLNDEGHLLRVITDARNGKYGVVSSTIADAAALELPVVQTRGRVAAQQQSASQQQEVAAAQENVGKIQAELEKLYPAHPNFKPPAKGEQATKESKYFDKWLNDNVGKPGEEGPLYGIVQKDPTQTPWLFERMLNDYNAETGAADAAELKLLKERRAKEDQAIGGGGETPSGDAPKTGAGTSAEVKAEINAKYGIVENE